MTCSKSISNKMLQVIMPPPRRGGAGALSGDRRPSSVRLSVCLSDVAYIGSNSKTKRPRKKLCTGVPQVTCDSHTDFKVKRSKVKVTGRGHIVAATQPAQFVPVVVFTHIFYGSRSCHVISCINHLCILAKKFYFRRYRGGEVCRFRHSTLLERKCVFHRHLVCIRFLYYADTMRKATGR